MEIGRRGGGGGERRRGREGGGEEGRDSDQYQCGLRRAMVVEGLRFFVKKGFLAIEGHQKEARGPSLKD